MSDVKLLGSTASQQDRQASSCGHPGFACQNHEHSDRTGAAHAQGDTAEAERCAPADHGLCTGGERSSNTGAQSASWRTATCIVIRCTSR